MIVICICNPMNVELQVDVLHMRYNFFKFHVILDNYIKTNVR
jgi:hypothetical protein